VPLRVFPVDTPNASFADEFGEHKGTDIFASAGTPVRAVDDGAVTFGTDPLGGNIAQLRSPDGTRYYYAHLSRYEGASRSVRAGDVVGYVGNTGNAAKTSPHLHFEVHPQGGAAVDPYPMLAALDPAGAANPPPWARKGAAHPSAPSQRAELELEPWAVFALLWWFFARKGR
jgi:murein DD-endopeptidase MepM/ murein hydrolase activator NlpD